MSFWCYIQKGVAYPRRVLKIFSWMFFMPFVDLVLKCRYLTWFQFIYVW